MRSYEFVMRCGWYFSTNSVLQSTTPVLLCTAKYYSSTTLTPVLLQYYSVLQSTTPVLFCTTKYYSSTSLYYKVLLHYYSVLHSTTRVQVVPGRAGGGSFRRKKNYIANKEFAYRMCARRPTSAMPKPFLCCELAFCCSMVVM